MEAWKGQHMVKLQHSRACTHTYSQTVDKTAVSEIVYLPASAPPGLWPAV